MGLYRVLGGPIKGYSTNLVQGSYKVFGAKVGSNNTGELAAIIEALLFAIEHGYVKITIHPDSSWAINMKEGR